MNQKSQYKLRNNIWTWSRVPTKIKRGIRIRVKTTGTRSASRIYNRISMDPDPAYNVRFTCWVSGPPAPGCSSPHSLRRSCQRSDSRV